VLGVCRRVLHDSHDAEDAFQATFLVLARRAGSRSWTESVGGYLFKVAFHMALKMKTLNMRRPVLFDHPEQQVDDRQGDPLLATDLRRVLDEELSRLPEKYRAPVVLCHCEGKSREQAARELGWKPGAVKIRLERAREVLRARLTRRGFALGGAMAALGLASPPASAGLIQSTVATARQFAFGTAPAAAAIPAALAEGVLRNALLTRLKIAALSVLLLGALAFGVSGLVGRIATAEKPAAPPEAAGPRERDVPKLAKAVPPPEVKLDRPVRVLLFASGPTRDYQFVRSLFVREVDRKRAELSIYLQTGGDGVVQDVPAERMLSKFPTALEDVNERTDAKAKYENLTSYDVIIAFDPDWTDLSVEQGKLLEKWVNEQGGGLIFIAGPINTHQLEQRPRQATLKPVLSLLPVVVDDIRLQGGDARKTPVTLKFPGATAEMKFLKLDPSDEDDPIAGWSEFFKAHGFYAHYPVKRVKPAATVIATVEDKPYLAVQSFGKGRALYVGSGETWRLRQFRQEFHEQFWLGLARYAASRDAKPGRERQPNKELTPAERGAIDKGLKWLVRQQLADGHWEASRGRFPITVTALAGTSLLMEGSTIVEGKYADQLRKSVDYLNDRGQRDGGFGNPRNQGEDYFRGHALATMLFSSVHGNVEDRERLKKIEHLLTRAVQFSENTQTKGGWPIGIDPDKLAQDIDLLTTTLQLRGLMAARNAGIAVPKQSIDKVVKLLEQRVKPTDPQAASAFMAIYPSGGLFSMPTARKRLQGLAEQSVDLGKVNSLDQAWEALSRAHAVYWLGDDGFAKLFPESKLNERLRWRDYRKRAFEQILEAQNVDGSWGNANNAVYMTAIYLMILQLDGGALPAFQR
jgi:RNA polymerase sigma factor (sigma-70 family)